MVKYRKIGGKDIHNEPLCRWLLWFNENSPPELVAEVVKMDNAIQMADERLVYLTGDEDAIRAYEMRFKALCDWTSDRNYAIETGHAEGFEKGMAEGIEKGMEKGMVEGIKKGVEESKLEIAGKMKTAGLPLAEIKEFTGLSSEILENI